MKKILRHFATAAALTVAVFLPLAAHADGTNYEGEDPGNSSGGGEEFKPLRTNAVAFLRLENPSICELGAQDLFSECYPKGSVISAEQFIDNMAVNAESGLYELTINGKHIEAVWIHVNRPDVNFWDESNGYILPSELMSEEFTKALYNYSIDGGKMYLSGIATKLLVRIGRQRAEYAPSIKDDMTNGFDNQTRNYREDHSDSWGVTGKLSDEHHDGNGGWGMCMHAIYGITWDAYPGYFASLENYGQCGIAGTDTGDKEYPTRVYVLGAVEGATLNHSNNNCMWDMRGDKNNWRYRNRAETIGTWHQENFDTQAIGIVEFVPDIDVAHNDFNSDRYGEYPRKSNPQAASRRDDSNENRPWLGNTIANGMAAFTYADNENNRYYNNLRNLTFNTINYLTQAYHEENMNDEDVIEPPITSGVEIDNAEILEVAPVYYNLQGVRVANPQGGIFVKVQGSKVSKVAIQ